MTLFHPVVKYTLARLGLLGVVFLLLLPVPGPSLVVKGLLAVVIALPLAWLLLRRWRDQAAVALAESAQRRREDRARLRAALAEPETSAEPETTDEAEPPER